VLVWKKGESGKMIGIAFRKEVSMANYQDLFQRIYYISDAIRKFELITQENKIIGLTLDFDSEKVSFNELEKKVNLLIEQEFNKNLSIPSKVKWKSKVQSRTYFKNIFQVMEEQGEAFEMGEGLVAVGQKFMKVYEFFDQQLKSIVMSNFNAKEYQYPTLLSYKALEKINYMNSFPQFLMFITHLHNEIDTYYKVQDSQMGYEEYIKMSDGIGHCLPPTMCYHTYQQYSGRQIPREGIVITSRGKSFRYESKYYKNLERLWDFTIREIVFMGDNDFVFKNNREILLQKVIELFDTIGLIGVCQSASDPFFADESMLDRRAIQMLKESKYEFRLNVDAEHTIAVGSSNLHNDYFGKAFDLKFADGDTIKTSCLGFGLERLTYAFFCQFGLDESKWPLFVRKRWNV